MEEKPKGQEEEAPFEALVADLMRRRGYRVRVGPRANPSAPVLRPDMAVDVDNFGTVLIETKPEVSITDLRNAVEQLHALLRAYPSAKAGLVVTSEPPPAGGPTEIVSVADLPDRLERMRVRHDDPDDLAEFIPLTPGTVGVSIELPFVSVATTLELPVVSASAVVTATLAFGMVGSAVVFLAVTGLLATSWQAIVALVAAVVFVTTVVALLLRLAPTSRLIWGVVGGIQRVGRDLAVATIASAVGTIVGTMLTLLLTGAWP